MQNEVKVILDGNIRKPDYEGSYTVVEDRGDTMLILIESSAEEELKLMKKRQDESENAIMTLMELSMMGGM